MSTLKVDNLLNSAGNESPISVPGAAKAWVCFDGGTGTQGQNDVTIASSFNVSSVTDNATGDYTLNFTNNMANTNYLILGRSNNQNAGGNNYVYTLASNSNSDLGGSYVTISSCRIGSTWAGYQSAPGLADHGRIMVAIFGD